ncbi:leucine-rich repeat domain-containing protein [Mariniphaga sediminis]|uniref:leucine-rich repeat domain-containing protein n=1 Tax=Mariniphaga sediminis TaxID=1628158 RepID=UPI00356791AB
MRDNTLATESTKRINIRPLGDRSKQQRYFFRIVTSRKREKQWKVERKLKSDFIDSTKFLRNVFTLLSLITLIFVIASCTKNDEQTELINDFVYILDKQFESILIEQNIDSDGVINQKISRTDALEVTHLDLNVSASNMHIEDLTGIEGFTNLTYLSASGHLIEEIDLSQNTQLDTVLLQANDLHSIHGLSKLESLIQLDLSWNLLDSLSFSSETIEVLLASHNHLKFFEVENADKLKSIILTSNKLSSINLRTSPLLETLLLSDNQIQTIDLRQKGNLSHLYISGNSLSELSVSNNQNLVDLRVDRNPWLTCIHIDNDQEIPIVSQSEYQELSTNCN